jgi:hypothetical protein
MSIEKQLWGIGFVLFCFVLTVVTLASVNLIAYVCIQH